MFDVKWAHPASKTDFFLIIISNGSHPQHQKRIPKHKSTNKRPILVSFLEPMEDLNRPRLLGKKLGVLW